MKLSTSKMVAYRIGFAFLGFSAIVTEIAVLVERGVFNPANFFSYFTIQSNILVVLTLLLTVLAKKLSARKIAALRGAVTTYILIVGIGFAVLLSGLENTVFTVVPWDNIVLHYIMPAVMLVDWIVDPPKRKFKFSQSLWWLAYPIAYVAYSLIRGEATGWYPYPFLDRAVSTDGEILFTVGALLALGAGNIALLLRFAKK